jgi:hypothetical protein
MTMNLLQIYVIATQGSISPKGWLTPTQSLLFSLRLHKSNPKILITLKMLYFSRNYALVAYPVTIYWY